MTQKMEVKSRHIESIARQVMGRIMKKKPLMNPKKIKVKYEQKDQLQGTKEGKIGQE
jgi:hypothetical protein